ncbi:hypothetical protein KJ836_01970 [Patescibacteria group bacterium]|nr:hypothetical protein [Patescibacteria group bacterium]
MNWFIKLLAKHGTPGSTANWACSQYLKFKKDYPNLEDVEFLEQVVKGRYKVLPDKEVEDYVLERLDGVQSLTNLVTLILVAENKRKPTMADLGYLATVEYTVQEVIDKRGLASVRF